MTRVRRGGYVFLTWRGDHSPRHVHVCRDGQVVVKWNLDSGVPMAGTAPREIVKWIRRLEAEGRL